MHTEEFVLIPKQMYTREQPHVSQLLSNKNIYNPAKQISLLQRNKSPSAPSASQQDAEQQTDASVDDRSTINESMAKSFTTDNTSTIRKRVLNDIRILKGIKSEYNTGHNRGIKFCFLGLIKEIAYQWYKYRSSCCYVSLQSTANHLQTIFRTIHCINASRYWFAFDL